VFADRQSWHFGVLPFTGTGQLNPLILLSQHLRDRGHKVTFFEKPRIEDRVRQAGLDFVAVGNSGSTSKGENPPVDVPTLHSQIAALRFDLRRIRQDLETYLRETPPALRQTGVNVLLVNEIALTGPTIAEILHVPYFIISTSVPHTFGWGGYPWFAGYKYSTSWFSGVQTALLEVSALRMRGPIRHALDEYRRQVGLRPIRQAKRLFPELAHITQLPKCLDLPRASLPLNFHYTGPFTNGSARPHVDFPWDRLDGRPMIYASLGTTRMAQAHVLRLIAEACQDLAVQLVISLGGQFDSKTFADLPGNPVVARYAPQLDLLKVAAVVITHGGQNTVLEALLDGKPMVAIPLAHDQPAVSARLARLGLAQVLPVMHLSAKRIRAAITLVLNDPGYREAAQSMQAKLHSINGACRAVEIMEDALEKHAVGAGTGELRT